MADYRNRSDRWNLVSLGSLMRRVLIENPLKKVVLYQEPREPNKPLRRGNGGTQKENFPLKSVVEELRKKKPIYRQAAFSVSINGISLDITLTKSEHNTRVTLGLVGAKNAITEMARDFFAEFKRELDYLVNSADFELKVASRHEKNMGAPYSKVLRQKTEQIERGSVKYEFLEDEHEPGKSPKVVSLVTTVREHAVGTLTNKTMITMPKLPESYQSAVFKLLEEQSPVQQVVLRQEDMPYSSKIPRHDAESQEGPKEDIIYMFDLKPGETNEEETRRLIREFDLLKQGVQNMDKLLGFLRGSAKTAVAVGKVGRAVAPGAPLGPADILLGAILAAFNWGMVAYNMIHTAIPFIKNNLEEGSAGIGDEIRQKIRRLKANATKLWDRRFKGMSEEQATKRLADENLAYAVKAFKSKEDLKKYLLTRTIEELMILPKSLVLFMNFLGFINTPTRRLLQVYNYITDQDLNDFRPPPDIPRRSYGNLLGETPEQSDEVEKQLKERWAKADKTQEEPKNEETPEDETEQPEPENPEQKHIGAEIWMYHPGIREEDQDDYEDLGWAIFLSQNIGIEPVSTGTILALAAITVAVIGATGLILSKIVPGMVERFYLKHGGIGDIVKKGLGKAKKIGKTVLLRLKGKNKKEIKEIFSRELEAKIKKMDGIQASKSLANITDISLFLNFEPEYLKKLIEQELLTPTQYQALVEKLPDLKKIDVSTKIYNPEYLSVINGKPDDYWINNAALFKNYAIRCVFSEARLAQLLDNRVIIPSDLSGVDCLAQFLVRYSKLSNSKKKKEKKSAKHGGAPPAAKSTPKPSSPESAMPTPPEPSPASGEAIASQYPAGHALSYDWAYHTSKKFSEGRIGMRKLVSDDRQTKLNYQLSQKSSISLDGYKGMVTVDICETPEGKAINAIRFLLKNQMTRSPIASYLLLHMDPSDRVHGRYRDIEKGYMGSGPEISRLFIEVTSNNTCQDVYRMVEFIVQSLRTLQLQAVFPLNIKAPAVSMNRNCSEELIKKYGFKQNIRASEEWILRTLPLIQPGRKILERYRPFHERSVERPQQGMALARG